MEENRKTANYHLISVLGGSCIKCKSTENLQLHHKIPLSKGGQDEVKNLEVLCTLCHNKAHNYVKKINKHKSIVLRFRLKPEYYFALIKKYPEFEINYSKAIREAIQDKYPINN